MTLHRFLVPRIPHIGSVELPDNEAHHASRVLRCTRGDIIVLFDGRGNEAEAVIESIDRRDVTVTIRSFQFAPRDHSNRLHFAVAMPKGDRQRNTIERLVELGVDSMCALQTKRSVAVVNEENVERLDRYVVEACKQCGRNRLMAIRPTSSMPSIRQYAESIAANANRAKTTIWILHPKVESHRSYSIHEANAESHDDDECLLFLIGPEGGFTDEEVTEAVNQGAKIMTLGDRIQRVETAAATAAVLGHCWLG